MFRKFVSLLLAGLLLNLACAQLAVADTKAEKEAKFIEKVKADIIRLGTGPEARIEVKLRNKTKIKGYVSEANKDHFMVVDAKTGATTAVSYPQVKTVKGHNLSTGAEIAIFGGIIAAIILITLFFVKQTK